MLSVEHTIIPAKASQFAGKNIQKRQAIRLPQHMSLHYFFFRLDTRKMTAKRIRARMSHRIQPKPPDTEAVPGSGASVGAAVTAAGAGSSFVGASVAAFAGASAGFSAGASVTAGSARKARRGKPASRLFLCLFLATYGKPGPSSPSPLAVITSASSSRMISKSAHSYSFFSILSSPSLGRYCSV